MKIILSLLAIALLCACAGNPPYNFSGDSEAALQATVAHRAPLAADHAAVRAYADFLQDLSSARVQAEAHTIYAPEAYFCDTLTALRGAAAITAYLHETVELGTIEARVTDIIAQDGEIYFRWTMTTRLDKLHDGKPIHSIGMSHLRFNAAGQIIYHQDYWDSSTGLFQYVPVIGPLVRRVRRAIVD